LRRLSTTDNNLMLAGAVIAVVLSYILVRRSTTAALGLLFLPLAGWLVTRSAGGVALGIAMMLVLPSWLTLGSAQATVGRLAAVAAATTLILAGGFRPRLQDWALLLLVGIMILAYFIEYDFHSAGRVLTIELTPVGFYVGARAVPDRHLRRVMLTVLFVGTFGALTVLYEYAHGAAVFVPPTEYRWNSLSDALFRPGGIYGSPPSASTVLSFVVLFGVGCLHVVRGRIMRPLSIICLGICVLALVATFTRATLIATGVGVVVLLWLVGSRLLRPTRVVWFAAAVAVFVIVALPGLEKLSGFQQGVARPGTLNAREGYWGLAMPIATASPQNFLFGIGSGALEAPRLATSAPLSLNVAATPQVYLNSLHSQYMTTLVEQGVIGLAALVFFFLAALVPVARRARLRRDPFRAAIAASIVAVAIVMAVDTAFLDASSFAMIMFATGLAAIPVGRARGHAGNSRRTEPQPSA
jgi:O-antigen ligase